MPLSLAVDWYILVGPWAPLVALAFLCIWGYVTSSIWDKDTLYWHFNREGWNIAHLACGTIGFALMILPIPVVWWSAVGFPVGLLVMWSSSVAYWIYHNRNVPEDQAFRLSAEGIRAKLAARAAARQQKAAAITIIDSKGVVRGLPSRDDPLFVVHMGLEDLLSPALVQQASGIELIPTRGGPYQVSQIVDGVRYRRDPLEPGVANAIIDYFKAASGLDVADKRRRQTGTFSVRFGAESHELRVRSAGSSAGQTLNVDFDIKKRVDIKPADLGLLPRQVEALDKATADLHGIILVSAPMGNGRTTTLYSLLRRHDAFTANIRTLEYERLVLIDGVGHSEFKADKGVDFATELRSILRRDPTILMVEDITDSRTAQEAAAPGIRGPLQYIGIRADSGLEALAKWAKAVGDLKAAAEPMKAVVSSRLLRKLCGNCKVPYQPDPNQLRKLGLPPEQIRQLFKPSGKVIERNREETCPACGGLGYRGQTGAYEIMVFDADARKLMAAGDLNGLKTHLRRLKTITIQDAALRKAIEGITSIEEVIRITRSPAAGGGQPEVPQPVAV